ncbi:unnamed protein product, partial [Ranitomeya imitator]
MKSEEEFAEDFLLQWLQKQFTRGTVIAFDIERGFGFIKEHRTGQDIYVSRRSVKKDYLPSRLHNLGAGEVVDFIKMKSQQGSFAAGVKRPFLCAENWDQWSEQDQAYVPLGDLNLQNEWQKMILLQRKRRDTENMPGTGMNLSWFARIYNASSGSFFTGRFIIKNLDIAYNIGRSANLCPKSVCLWPSSKDGSVYIPYSISSDFDSYDTTVIKASLSDIEDATCIRFKPKTSEADYITFVASTGCWSSVGRVGGVQYISLEKPGCVWSGIITHEVLHALGLNHEHVRRDRDKHVEVEWNNIQSDARSNFEMADTYNKDLTAYDYDSILHYPNMAFSKDGIEPTLVAVLDSSLKFGQQFSMSYLDIKKINSLYKCKPHHHTNHNKEDHHYDTNHNKEDHCYDTKNNEDNHHYDTNHNEEDHHYDPKHNKDDHHYDINQNVIPDRITFKDFNIEGDGMNCQYDKLRIYNGRDFDVLYQLRDFCGQNLPLPITSSSNSMQIVFTSDLSIEKRGFSLVYQRGAIGYFKLELALSISVIILYPECQCHYPVPQVSVSLSCAPSVSVIILYPELSVSLSCTPSVSVIILHPKCQCHYPVPRVSVSLSCTPSVSIIILYPECQCHYPVPRVVIILYPECQCHYPVPRVSVSLSCTPSVSVIILYPECQCHYPVPRVSVSLSLYPKCQCHYPVPQVSVSLSCTPSVSVIILYPECQCHYPVPQVSVSLSCTPSVSIIILYPESNENPKVVLSDTVRYLKVSVSDSIGRYPKKDIADTDIRYQYKSMGHQVSE